jgi:hypothetical protein
MLYSDNKSIYTFWKQYEVLDNNDINNINIIDKVNYQIEWQNNINTLINDTLNTQNINSIILDELFNTFFSIENYIVNLILDIKDFHNIPLGRSLRGEKIVRGYLSDIE